MEVVFRRLSVLKRTRRSLTADVNYLDKSGQLLDRSLAKQEQARQAELDSLLPNSVSVIVRSSTPEPSQSCDEVFFPHSHPPAPGLQSLSAPQVPWTPPRGGSHCLRNPSYPIHQILNSPRSSSLLAPLFTNSVDITEQEDMAIQQTKEECDAKIRKFNQLIRRYDPDPFEPDAVQNKEQEWSKELSNALDDLVDSIETMSVKHGHDLGSQEVAVWKKRITDSEGQFRNFTNKVAIKIRPLRSNTTTPSINVPMPVAAPPDATNQSQAVSNALADVKVDAEMVATEGKELAAKVNKYLDWSDATNDEIELAMANIEGWQKKFTKIREKSFSIKRNTLKFNLDDLYLKRSEAVVNNLETELELAIEDITSEDKDRCLFSITKSKPADVKLPYFSGNKEEDFSKFRKEFEKGLKTNRVRKEDQIKKLREFLKGDAKTIIPNSMENIDTAWDILKSMYGDASRVMAARKRKIKDMGSFPRSGKPQVMLKNQIEWITKLEVTLNDIKELAEESAQMERDAYSSDMMHLIMSYFPNMIHKECSVSIIENLKIIAF